MPSGARHKRSGGDKDSADKNTFNPLAQGGAKRSTQTEEPEEHFAGERIGQFGDEGQPPLIKK